MSQTDFYATLGVSKSASESEIKKAYRKLAMQYHPDKNAGDKQAEKKFKEINAAYEVLKDAKKRQQYDNFGSSGFDNFGGGSSAGQGFGGMNFGDIFSDFFGDNAGHSSSRKPNVKRGGADLRYNISVTLEEAYQGKVENISFTANQTCDKCEGYGSSASKTMDKCGTCHGSGRIRAQQGFFIVEQACAKCEGLGEIIKDPCNKCHGSGRYERKNKLKVNIPAGVDSGTRIRLEEQGEAGFRRGKAGDLYIFVNVEEHKFFVRQGSSINCTVPIKFTTAAIGGKILVPTISGSNVELKIPAGSQNKSKFRLKNEGMKIVNSSLKGDMFVAIDIEIPVKLTAKQKELLQELDQELENNPAATPNLENFLKKFKSFFS